MPFALVALLPRNDNCRPQQFDRPNGRIVPQLNTSRSAVPSPMGIPLESGFGVRRRSWRKNLGKEEVTLGPMPTVRAEVSEFVSSKLKTRDAAEEPRLE